MKKLSNFSKFSTFFSRVPARNSKRIAIVFFCCGFPLAMSSEASFDILKPKATWVHSDQNPASNPTDPAISNISNNISKTEVLKLDLTIKYADPKKLIQIQEGFPGSIQVHDNLGNQLNQGQAWDPKVKTQDSQPNLIEISWKTQRPPSPEAKVIKMTGHLYFMVANSGRRVESSTGSLERGQIFSLPKLSIFIESFKPTSPGFIEIQSRFKKMPSLEDFPFHLVFSAAENSQGPDEYQFLDEKGDRIPSFMVNVSCCLKEENKTFYSYLLKRKPQQLKIRGIYEKDTKVEKRSIDLTMAIPKKQKSIVK